MFSIE